MTIINMHLDKHRRVRTIHSMPTDPQVEQAARKTVLDCLARAGSAAARFSRNPRSACPP